VHSASVSETVDAVKVVSGTTVHIVRGDNSILRLQAVLTDLSARCGQQGVMDDIGYFLSKPGTLKRVPHLLLISKAPVLDMKRLTANDLVGAVLLYKYTVLGCGIRTFSTNDRSGRGTLIAPAALRSTIAELVTRKLIDGGALAVLISFRDSDASNEKEEESDKGKFFDDTAANDKSARWVRREREIPDYLQLQGTFDATLAGIGQRTRSNLRYYRRRTERDLGCVFVPAIQMGEAEFLAFNRECMYAVPSKVASWRYHGRKDVSAPLLMGIKDRDGRWLSLLGGRRHHKETEILWQMNRDGLSAYSLSLVMRSYFMEHEIREGMTKFFIEGGTPHPMRFSFVNSKVTDLVVLRRSSLGRLVPKLVKIFIKPDNDLALMLLDKGLYGGSLEQNSPHFSLEKETN
jgi:hypothetical protein